MQKNIAILTLYYRNANYGGILQAYALQKQLSNFGYNAKQISYILDSGYKPKTALHEIIKILKSICRFFKNRRWVVLHNQFKKKLFEFADGIPHTKVVTAQNIHTLVNQFDIFICGSDQIWNPIGWQPTLFLDFLPQDKVKIAYAASVARNEMNIEELDFMKKYIQNFSAISVREENTAKILKRHFPELNIQVMPDPTLLLTKEEWDEEASPVLIKKPYIFAYFLGEDTQNREEAIRFAEKYNVTIVFIPYMKKDMFKWDEEHKKYMLKGIGIKEFLSLVKNANMVITDSFHGTVFSLIYKKAFYAMRRFKDTDVNSMNSRIETLLKNVGLEKRYVQKLPRACMFDLSEKEINLIDEKLYSFRNEGKGYLKNYIDKIETS